MSWPLALACALGALSCSDLATERPPPDGGDGGSPDTEIVEPPDPPGPSPWARRTPEPSPQSRAAHALVYDPVRARVVLFGGFSTRPLRDLWEWDGQTRSWTDRTPNPVPALWPPPRSAHALAWDPARQRVVLFGGDTGRGVWLQDVWEWDGGSGTWTNRTPSSIAPETWPDRRFHTALAADETRGKLVLYAGAYAATDSGVGGTPFGDVWEWDGVQGSWTDRTPDPVPADWPPARLGHAMVWDGKRQRVVMMMGTIGESSDPVVQYDASAWEWDGVTGRWGRVTAAGGAAGPAGRANLAWAWDPVRDRFLSFGGWRPPRLGESIVAEPYRDAWELDRGAGTWSERTLAAGSAAWPLARSLHAMVFDPGRARVVLFGGLAKEGQLKDTWEWDGAAP